MTLMALIAPTVGMVPSKRTWRQTQAGVGAKPTRERRQSQIHANFFQYPPMTF